MNEYKRVSTSAEVCAAILAAHPDLKVFSSHTSINEGRAFTSYGFENADFPIMEAETIWGIDMDNPQDRDRKKVSKYWLCLPINKPQ